MSEIGLAGLESAIVQKLRVDGPQDMIDLVVDLAQPPSLVKSAIAHLERVGTVEQITMDGKALYQTPITAPFART